MDDRTGLREIAKRWKFNKLYKGQEIVEGAWYIEGKVNLDYTYNLPSFIHSGKWRHTDGKGYCVYVPKFRLKDLRETYV